MTANGKDWTDTTRTGTFGPIAVPSALVGRKRNALSTLPSTAKAATRRTAARAGLVNNASAAN